MLGQLHPERVNQTNKPNQCVSSKWLTDQIKQTTNNCVWTWERAGSLASCDWEGVASASPGLKSTSLTFNVMAMAVMTKWGGVRGTKKKNMKWMMGKAAFSPLWRQGAKLVMWPLHQRSVKGVWDGLYREAGGATVCSTFPMFKKVSQSVSKYFYHIHLRFIYSSPLRKTAHLPTSLQYWV